MNYEPIVRVLGGPGFGVQRTAGPAAEPRMRRLIRIMREHARHQRDYNRLLDQPDHLLRDIGVTREQVSRKIRLFPF